MSFWVILRAFRRCDCFWIWVVSGMRQEKAFCAKDNYPGHLHGLFLHKCEMDIFEVRKSGLSASDLKWSSSIEARDFDQNDIVSSMSLSWICSRMLYWNVFEWLRNFNSLISNGWVEVAKILRKNRLQFMFDWYL